MSKMLPVPMINGLDELLAIVKNDMKATDYLNQMKKLKADIKRNLIAYKNHNDADTRISEAEHYKSEAEMFREEALAAKTKTFASIAKRQKAIRLRETKATMEEKLLKELLDQIHRGQHNLDLQKKAFEARLENFEQKKEANKQDLIAQRKNLDKREVELEKKYKTIAELFG